MSNYYFPYDYPTVESGAVASQTLSMFIAIYAIALLAAFAIGLVIYILRALALTRLSQNRGFSNPWLGWIPFCGGYALGRISDDINIKRGKLTNHRKILLAMQIVVGILELIALGFMLSTFIPFIQYGIDAPFDIMPEYLLLPLLVGLAFMLLAVIAAIVHAIFYYIALYTIFKDYAPNNAVLYLVLTLLVSGSDAVILFILRNKTPIPPMPPYGGYPYPPQQYGQYMPPR